MDIGKRLRELRIRKNMTVNALADKSGVSQSYIREVERNNKNISVDRLTTLCCALEISMKDFFDEDNSPIVNDPLLLHLYKLTPTQRKHLQLFLESMNS